MTKLANKYTESMMKAIDETKNFEKLTEIQGLTLMYALLKQRNYTKFHKDSKYINPNKLNSKIIDNINVKFVKKSVST